MSQLQNKPEEAFTKEAKAGAALGCCTEQKQSSCCEQTAKSKCCSEEKTAQGGCGCQ